MVGFEKYMIIDTYKDNVKKMTDRYHKKYNISYEDLISVLRYLKEYYKEKGGINE